MITNIVVTPTGPGTVRITFDSDVVATVATAQVNYGPTAGYGALASPGTVTGATGAWHLSINVTGLLGTWHFQCVATTFSGDDASADQIYSPPPLSSPDGEEQLWASVNDWLEANVPASINNFTYNFDQALDPAVMPRVDVSQFNFFEPGDTALGGVIFPKNPAGRTQGKANRVMLELNIRDDGNPHTDALMRVRRIRDLLNYALINAGFFSDDNGFLIMPPIIVYDRNGNTTNTVARVMTESDNAIIKNFYKPSPPESTIFRYQLLYKLEWYELL